MKPRKIHKFLVGLLIGSIIVGTAKTKKGSSFYRKIFSKIYGFFDFLSLGFKELKKFLRFKK